MKRILTFFALLGWVVGYGQLYDGQWVIGEDASVLDFRNPGTIWESQPFSNSLDIFLTDATICDKNGTLLYYTNGIGICNASDTLPNGAGLSPCVYTTQVSCCGLGIPQAAIFIPVPGDTEFYYLLHFSNDTLGNSRPGTLYYTLIDNAGNGGTGSIVKKNVPLLKGVALREGGMTACKHANGRDYWVVVEPEVVNEFYEFLITPDSILGPYIQKIGPEFTGAYDNAYSKFSQDGSKFATGILEGPIILMDFDRCTGEFGNVINILHNASTDLLHPVNGCTSLEFSPNGEYLYMTNAADLTQYDLYSGNIQDSSEIYFADSTDQYLLFILQLAGNGKLYCSPKNGGLYAIHVVNNPDLKGDSADFVYGGQSTLSQDVNSLPNMINYNLGSLIGSGCDTILSLSPSPEERDLLLRIQPNPANKYVYVEMGMQGNYEFDLLNALGQLIATKQTRQVDIFDTEGLANGVYYIRATPKSPPGQSVGINSGDFNTVITGKLVVQH